MSKKEPYIERFPNLSLKEFRLLCFMVYYGESGMVSTSATSYCKKYRENSRTLNDTIETLFSKGLLLTKSFVRPEKQLQVLDCLYRYYPTWAESFKYMNSQNRTHSAEYLSRIAKLLIKDDFSSAAKIPRPYENLGYKQFNIFKYIQEEIVRDPRYMTLVNDHELPDLVSETLNEKFMHDELDEQVLQFFSSSIPVHHSKHDELSDVLATYRYFLTGQTFTPAGMPTLWYSSIQAIQQMYEGHLEEAYQTFKQISELNKKKGGALPHAIFNYAYGILLYRLSQKDKGKYGIDIAAFRQSKEIQISDENLFIRLLLELAECDLLVAQAYIERKLHISVLPQHNTPFLRSMKYLLLHFFEMSDESVQHPFHSAQILQHEMSLYQPIGPKAKETLCTIFGGKPLLSLIRKKTSWEIFFSDISQQIKQPTAKQEKRIVYYIEDTHLNSIVEQAKGNDGCWHNGQVLSRQTLCNNGYDFMDNTDVAIASQLPKATKDTDVLIPLLIGTDRLYVGDYFTNHFTPCEIVSENPTLSFQGKGSTIEITSNISIKSNGTIPRHNITDLGNGKYMLVSVNALQRDIMKRFLQKKAIPSSALVTLRNTIESLKGIIDVRENILQLLDMPATMSDGVLVIRITPEDTDYKLNISAAAMIDGTCRFVPSEGDEVVYDEAFGITHCIRRNLKLELEHYQMLQDFLTEYIGIEMEDYTHCTLGTSQSLLDLLNYVHEHHDIYFVEWPEGVQLRLKGTIQTSDIQIDVKSDIDWFSIEGNVNIGNKKYTLQELIKMCKESPINGYIRLSDEEYARISDQLKKHIAMLDSLPSKKGKVQEVSKYHVGTLAQLIADLRCNTDGGYASFMEKTKAAYSLQPAVPKNLQAQLRDYQINGFQWMCRLDAWGAGACLADDMGLGKTIQALAFLLYKASQGASLVIAPKSVILNWVSEARRFAPSLNFLNINSLNNREKAIDLAGPNDVILCTYGLLVTQGETLIQKQWNVVCLDEAHQIKNRQTIASRTVMDLQATSRIILTGTPLQNHLGELWNLFQFINPGLLGTWTQFRDNYILPALDERHRLLLKEITQPFILRRTKNEVLSELPEKYVFTHMVEMTEKEMKTYEEMRSLVELVFKKNKSKSEREATKGLHISYFAELTKLRLASCSMKLIQQNWAEPSSKIAALLDMLNNLMECPDNNILIFSQFTSFLTEIKPFLKRRGWDYLYLDGQTPLEKRQDLVNQFQANQCRLFLSSLKAGGLGINLTMANTVILLDPWWNPAIENQATDRAHRLGQKRVVSVIRLISSHTIEEKILRLHETKQQLTGDILEGTSDSYTLTYEEIMDLITPF